MLGASCLAIIKMKRYLDKLLLPPYFPLVRTAVEEDSYTEKKALFFLFFFDTGYVEFKLTTE